MSDYVCLARKYRPQNFGMLGEYWSRVNEVWRGRKGEISFEDAIRHVTKEFSGPEQESKSDG